MLIKIKETIMNTVNIYLNFNGNCEEAFNFYKEVLGGEISYLSRFGEFPESRDFKIPDEFKEHILHVTLPVGGDTLLMGSDTFPGMGGGVSFGDNFSVCLQTDTKEEADRLFNGLAEGGGVIMPMADVFWGDYYGQLSDKFGVKWMVICPGK
jgi:PhnB protein